MITSHESSMMLAEVLQICAKLGCDIRFVRNSSKSNGSMTLHGVSATYHKSIARVVAEHMQSNPALAKLSHFTLEEDLPMTTREKTQAMLLERVEILITQYDEENKRCNSMVMDSAKVLDSIAKVLQTIGYQERELTTFAAPILSGETNNTLRDDDQDFNQEFKLEAVPQAPTKPVKLKNLVITPQDIGALKTIGIELLSDNSVPRHVAVQLGPLLEERIELRQLICKLLKLDGGADVLASLRQHVETPPQPQEPPA